MMICLAHIRSFSISLTLLKVTSLAQKTRCRQLSGHEPHFCPGKYYLTTIHWEVLPAYFHIELVNHCTWWYSTWENTQNHKKRSEATSQKGKIIENANEALSLPKSSLASAFTCVRKQFVEKLIRRAQKNLVTNVRSLWVWGRGNPVCFLFVIKWTLHERLYYCI